MLTSKKLLTSAEKFALRNGHFVSLIIDRKSFGSNKIDLVFERKENISADQKLEKH